MTYKLSSGRRYMNGELVDPPELGPWVEGDLFPVISDEWVTAGLFELNVADEDEYQVVEWWLAKLHNPDVPVLFLIERCCHEGELLHVDMRETRLQEFPKRWRTACRAAIQEVVEYGGVELISVIAWAVRIERARRHADSSGF
jgi:hypothetical protein